MEEEKKPSKRGGKRIGAGRKPEENPRMHISFRIPKDLYNIVMSQNNVTGWIEDAIRRKLKEEGVE